MQGLVLTTVMQMQVRKAISKESALSAIFCLRMRLKAALTFQDLPSDTKKTGIKISCHASFNDDF